MFEKKNINKTVNKILKLKSVMEKKTDEELKFQTEIFKHRIQQGESLDSILPEAFATVREASKRVLGMEHFPVQLMGGIALHKGYVSEQKTGEGKTLVSTCPAYLNALTGKPVHIVTVNDYLAKRDAEQMGQVHEFLGLSVGVVLNEMTNLERKQAYSCDITYVTNNELGFDYLRDNMVQDKDSKVLRGLSYCIIDEADSVLIDEARTPLIISGQSSQSTSLYIAADLLAKRLKKGKAKEFSKVDAILGEEIEESGDFIVEEKEKQVHLTEEGVKKVEEFFHIENLANPENIDIQHHMNLALKANYIMKKDKDYVVKEDKVLIVDEFTGRTMPGRRFSDGLHQAIESKEGVDIKRESRTYATITFQSFFNKFEKKSGMTGTARTEEKEFKKIYRMDVIEIPTNKPLIRKDYDDVVYKTKKEKYEAIVKEVKESYEKKQPVLVGTISIETSELISKMLKKEGIPHHVLNAKYVEKEAEIISHAGEAGAVTVATNMAGRGTDIKLDEEAKQAGGLKIIGSERHESRRIDNQLRGRSGRQGDPGESKFYLSLEDDLMRLFGSEHMIQVLEENGIEYGEEIKHRLLSKAIENAQKKIEYNNLDIRERLYKYDQINNEQRELIYSERNSILDNESIREIVVCSIKETIHQIITRGFAEKKSVNEILSDIYESIPLKIEVKDYEKMNQKQMIKKLDEDFDHFYQELESKFENIENLRKLEKMIFLKILDQKWMNHIDDMEKLRESISLQSYAQKDPLVEYKITAYQMFYNMVEEIKNNVTKVVSHIQVVHND